MNAWVASLRHTATRPSPTPTAPPPAHPPGPAILVAVTGHITADTGRVAAAHLVGGLVGVPGVVAVQGLVGV
ncbi:MAG TPA: hypothetical protein VHN80_02060 [Kineosporiaceae bacterium]|nr:hypothetical protein [Kineosporiaceae bacterium]